VDLPIANTIVVEDATHLGVSQMYQLKGRVEEQCQGLCLVSLSATASPATRSRIHSTVKLLNYSDSYALAELDTRYRGIGEIFGIRQHGLVNKKTCLLWMHCWSKRIGKKKLKLCLGQLR